MTADSIVPTSGTFDVKLLKYGGSLGITINGEHTRTHTHTTQPPYIQLRDHMTSHAPHTAAAGNTKPGDPIWINRLKKGGVAYRWVKCAVLYCAVLCCAVLCCAVLRLTHAVGLELCSHNSDGQAISLSIKHAHFPSLCPSPLPLPITPPSVPQCPSLLPLPLSPPCPSPLPLPCPSLDSVGSLKPGDVILAINGRSLGNATLQDAAELLKTSMDVVTLTISKDVDYGA